ncbi:branched-chain amino acid ABC transporter permease [Pigmentiphaga sp.]|uniref:branched-chain amino acid ABC transporter permease n=1 Tax=Pigmentiphaga sp. TaxID=1977564 RepID=UPI0025D2490A|nr:branched-chain amino acid ABC transporter permease [Pigmentiphaga sp.]MBX6319680.1 branched-chain amino acid ABC transporter permease [Pigmentiphaga sp.]
MDRFGEAYLRTQRRWHWAEACFWIAVAAAWFVFPDNLVLGTQILIAALFALSLDLVMGYAGIVTLGHAAFFGIGAYAAGKLGQQGWSEPFTGLLLGGLAAAVVAVATARLVCRGHDLSRLMVTLGLGMLLFELANKASEWTGGLDGMLDIEIAPLFGVFEFDMAGRVGYVYCAVVLFAWFLLARHLVRQPFGLSLHAVRLNPIRARAIGLDTAAALSRIYVLSAMMAGTAGALLAQTNQYVALDVLSFQRSADVATMLIIGGLGQLYGGLVGAGGFVVAQDALSGLNPEYWQFWLGLVLVLVVLFVRGGVVELLRVGYRRALAQVRRGRP